MKFSLIIFFILTQNALAISVFYDKSTGDVKAFGAIDPVQYTTEHPELGYFNVKDDHPILKDEIRDYKYDPSSKSIVKKSNAQITARKNSDRKKEIENKIESLLKRIDDKNKLSKEGFDVSASTTSIRKEIDDLKVEYQAIGQ